VAPAVRHSSAAVTVLPAGSPPLLQGWAPGQLTLQEGAAGAEYAAGVDKSGMLPVWLTLQDANGLPPLPLTLCSAVRACYSRVYRAGDPSHTILTLSAAAAEASLGAAAAGVTVLRLRGFRPGASGGFGSPAVDAAFDELARPVLASESAQWCCRCAVRYCSTARPFSFEAQLLHSVKL
jgi:hypothetical protein